VSCRAIDVCFLSKLTLIVGIDNHATELCVADHVMGGYDTSEDTAV
jgi:hypothetical protein